MTSLWSRRRTLVTEGRRRIVATGALTAALVAAFAVLAGTSVAAPRVAPVTHPVASVDKAPQPTPASDEYGKPPGYKTKCTTKANAAYRAAIARAKAALAAQLKTCPTQACKTRARNQYKAAVAAALRTKKQNLKLC